MKHPEHLRIDQVQLAPGQEWTLPSHAWRVLRLSKGEAYWLDAAMPRAIAQGELMVLAPGTEGILRASQLNTVVVDWFVFDLDLLCGFFTVAERYLLQKAVGVTIGSIQILPGSHALPQSMAELLEDCAGPELIQRGELLLVALQVLAPALPSPEQNTTRGAPAHDRFNQIFSHMPEMELIQHSAEQLAHMCGCTTRHFSRLFREQFGQSPRSRQTELRLLKARELLDSSDQTVLQVATECGYRSLSLFNSLFKRRFGMTPSQWRHRVQHETPQKV
jgi:AraC-like DNA-binding protein